MANLDDYLAPKRELPDLGPEGVMVEHVQTDDHVPLTDVDFTAITDFGGLGDDLPPAPPRPRPDAPRGYRIVDTAQDPFFHMVHDACGCVVWNSDVHDAWHNSLGTS